MDLGLVRWHLLRNVFGVGVLPNRSAKVPGRVAHLTCMWNVFELVPYWTFSVVRV